MPVRVVEIPGLGEILLAKRRGTRNLKLSVTARGVIRVSMPYWVPYSAGINFARSKSQWLLSQQSKYQRPIITEGSTIGHNLTVKVVSRTANAFKASSDGTFLNVSLPSDSNISEWQSKLATAAEKALKKEAVNTLPQRVETLAQAYGFNYQDLRIRKMTSRWGTCSSKKIITLSYYLVQLPANLADYVIIHELLHTRYMHHGPEFWQAFEEIMPGAKKIRKAVNTYRPVLAITP